VLVPPKNSKALADALIKIIGDESAKHRFGEAARRVLEERFSHEVAMKRIQGLYRRLLVEPQVPSFMD